MKGRSRKTVIKSDLANMPTGFESSPTLAHRLQQQRQQAGNTTTQNGFRAGNKTV
jgi:hypothetical protein